MESNGMLPNGTNVMLVINKDNTNRTNELYEMLTGYPTNSMYRENLTGIIVSCDPEKNTYIVKWENAASQPGRNGYLMYPNELISLDALPPVKFGPSPPYGKGGGKKARRSRKSRKSRKVHKSYKKYRKSRKVRKSRRRARR